MGVDSFFGGERAGSVLKTCEGPRICAGEGNDEAARTAEKRDGNANRPFAGCTPSPGRLENIARCNLCSVQSRRLRFYATDSFPFAPVRP